MKLFKILYINFKKILFVTFFIIAFNETFVKFKTIFYLLKIILLQIFAKLSIHIDYLHSNIEYMMTLIFIIIFHGFLISFCILINGVIYSSSNTFSTIINVSISVETSNFTLVFFKAACHSNPGAERYFRRIKLIYIKTRIVKVLKCIR